MRQANLLSLALALAAVSCASALPPPPPSTPELLAARRYREVLERAGQLHAGQREAFIEAFAQATRPAVLVDVLPNEDVEAQIGELFPIGLDDFLFLRVQVSEALPDVVLSPHVAVMADTPKGQLSLPMNAPRREVFVAFTGERPAGKQTGYQLKPPGLPFLFNIVTLGVFELLFTKVERTEHEPAEQDQERAAPIASRLARVVTPPHGCAEGKAPCDRYIVMPRPRDDVPLRLFVDLDLGYGAGPSVRASQRFVLPPGKPLEARLADVFHGAPMVFGQEARWSLDAVSTLPPGGCKLRAWDCGAAALKEPTAEPPPPAIPAPPKLATPAESLAARPRWASPSGYAPKTDLGSFSPAAFVAGGPLLEVVLACDTDVRFKDVDFPVDLPDVSIDVRVGKGPVYRTWLPDDKRKGRFFVPLVSLDPGDKLELSIWDRDSSLLFGGSDDLLATPALVYRGVLPLEHNTPSLSIACRAIARADIEKVVEQRLAKLAEAIRGFNLGVHRISESKQSWGLDAWGVDGLRYRLGEVASLVGWSDPRIQAVSPVIERYQAMVERHLRRVLEARSQKLPKPGEVLSLERGDLRVVGSACGAAIDRKRVLWHKDKVPKDGCVTIVEVTNRGPEALETSPRTGSIGALWSMELAWADGRRTSAWSVGVELPEAAKKQDPEHPRLFSGQAVRFYLAPEQVFHREGQEGPLFLIGLDRLNTTLVRLR